MKKFKKIQDMKERVKYAEAHLPRLGSGAARVTFGLGSGKVLKVVHRKRGHIQTENEVEAYTADNAKNFLAKIFDFDSKNYMWLVAEGVKVFKDNSDLMAKIHPSELIMEWVATAAYHDNSFEEAVNKAIEVQNRHYAKGFEEDPNIGPLKRSDLNKLDLTLLRNLFEATKAGIEDIDRLDHWGMTTDGRIVIADYGLTEEGFRNV